jgi:hypothetical protein
MIVPATQQAADATGVNNPFPGFASTDPLPNSLQGITVAAKVSSDKENMAILAGSDEYLGAMTHLSNADTDLGGLVQTGTDLTGTTNA